MRSDAQKLDDLIVRLLLRYFRRGSDTDLDIPEFVLHEDLSHIRLNWAVSPIVSDLLAYILKHRHELQASISSRLQTHEQVVRGRIDARQTLLERMVSGDPARIAYWEPVKQYQHGPNQLLFWVLTFVLMLCKRFARDLPTESGYGEALMKTRRLTEQVARLDFVGQALAEVRLSDTPSPQAITQAARARTRLYRNAYEAYRALQQLESGDAETLKLVLSETLVAPLERWRRFELGLLLSMANALSDQIDEQIQLSSIRPGQMGAIATVGSYRLYWQSKTNLYTDPAPEPSEVLVGAVLEQYGLAIGDDRPDVIVIDTSQDKVVAVGEAKYYAGSTDSWQSALREATGQIVRYARGYEDADGIGNLLGKSIVGLKSFPRDQRPEQVGANTPLAVDLDDLIDSSLQLWAERITAQ